MKKLALLTALILALGTLPAFAEGTDDQFGYINADTKVYMDASEKAIVDSSATLGMQVHIDAAVVAEGTEWYNVTFTASKKTGWVKADDVDLVIAKKALAVSAAAPVGDGPQPIQRESDFPVLTASGQVPPVTDNGSSSYRTLDVGDSGADVKAVSERLFALGFLDAKHANKMTTAHTTAIKKFQKANKLTEDGICSPELQAKLFSSAALNSKGKTVAANDPLTITKGTVKANKKGGGTVTFTFKNNSGQKIDAFDFTLRLYNTYGERFLIGSIYNDATLNDELTVFDASEERMTLSKNQQGQISIPFPNYYFAGCMVAITAYHIAGGDTVRIADDQRHWYGFGKGVSTGFQDLVVTPLTDGEKKAAERWNTGIEGIYVDGEIAKQYGIREGCLIQKLEPNSLMDAAGLKAGDVLLAVGDYRIFGAASLTRAMAALQPGDTAVVLFLRNGTVHQTVLGAPVGASAA